MKKILQIMPLPDNLAAVIRYVDEEHNIIYEHLNSLSNQRCCLLALVHDDELHMQTVEPLIWDEDCRAFMIGNIADNEEIQIVSNEWLEFNDYFSEL